jgi:hypothetical protein
MLSWPSPSPESESLPRARRPPAGKCRRPFSWCASCRRAGRNHDVLLAVVDVGDAVVMVLAHGRKAYTTSRTPWQKSNNTWRGHNSSTTMATPDSSSSSADVVANHDQGVHAAACLRRCPRGGTPTAGMTAWPCHPGLLAGVRSCRSSSMAAEIWQETSSASLASPQEGRRGKAACSPVRP